MGRKIYEFYNAPIVKFWFHTVGVSYSNSAYISCILLEMSALARLPAASHSHSIDSLRWKSGASEMMQCVMEAAGWRGKYEKRVRKGFC